MTNPAALRFNDFQINELIIISGNGDETDIRDMVIELNIYEDIFANTLSGDMVIVDSLNLIKNIPIVGQERVRISFNSGGRIERSIVMDTYKISNRRVIKEQQQVYAVHLVSPEFKINLQKRISKSYKTFISSIYDDIMCNNENGIKLNNIEPSGDAQVTDFKLANNQDKKIQVIIPNLHPFSAINWLAKRIQSDDAEGANVLFFQTIQGFYFTSIEKLVQRRSLDRLLFEPINIKDKKESIDLRTQSVRQYEVVSSFDIIQNIAKGLYGSTLISHDILNKKIETKILNYKDEFPKFKHLHDGNKNHQFISSIHSPVIDFPFAVLKVQPKHDMLYTGPESQTPLENNIDNWSLQRAVQMQELKNFNINATIQGNSDFTVGRVVEFEIPSPEPSPLINQSRKAVDKQFSERFLITKIRHRFQFSHEQNQYEMDITLAKDSLAIPFP